MPPSTEEGELIAAIKANSDVLVLHCVKEGANANANVRVENLCVLKSQNDNDPIYDFPRGVWFSSPVPGDVPRECTQVPLLFWALRNCYSNAVCFHSSFEDTECGKVLKVLLDHGADPAGKNDEEILVYFSKYAFHLSINVMTALQFAATLKAHEPASSVTIKAHSQTMTAAFVLLTQARDRQLAFQAGPKVLMDSNVPASTSAMWAGLLFSEDFSDVQFKSAEGEVIHAHRCVLAGMSTKFSTLFRGPWKENAEKEIQTDHSPELVRAMLRFIYIGKLDAALLEKHTAELMSVASEYLLPDLRKLCEKWCIEQLSEDTVKRYLIMADLHGSTALKQACFAFVKHNACTVLTTPEMIALAKENEKLWDEMSSAVREGTEGQRNVRQRVN
jgi:speckle-type POZ protein